MPDEYLPVLLCVNALFRIKVYGPTYTDCLLKLYQCSAREIGVKTTADIPSTFLVHVSQCHEWSLAGFFHQSILYDYIFVELVKTSRKNCQTKTRCKNVKNKSIDSVSLPAKTNHC